MIKNWEDVREDGHDGHITGIEGEDKDHSNEVVYHPIDLVTFRLAHEKPELTLPYFGEAWVLESKVFEEEDRGETDRESGDEGFE